MEPYGDHRDPHSFPTRRSSDLGHSGPVRFERSLELDRARDADVLLAYAMNGEALPHQHGYPLRLIVPGWYAVASVKRSEEHTSELQSRRDLVCRLLLEKKTGEQ